MASNPSFTVPAPIISRLEDYGRYCFLALLFLVPVAFTQSTLNMFDLPKFALLWVLGIGALGLSQARYFATRARTPSLAVRLTTALTLLGVVATVVSPYPVVSALGIYNRYGGLVTQLLFLGLLIAMIRLYRPDHRTLDGIAAASALAAALITAYTLVQSSGLDWMQWSVLGERVTKLPHGTLGNSNYNGAYLGIAFPFFVYLALVSPKRWLSALILTAGGFACVALWQTSTRGGMLALMAGVAVMAIGLREELGSALKRKALSKRTILVTISALLLASAVVGASTPDRVTRIFRTESIAARLGWWTSSVELIADHPWFGTGFNTFYASVLPYGDQPLPQDRNLKEDFADEPHNIFLSRAAGSGVPALVAYLLLLGSTVFFALRRLGHRPPRDRLRTVTFTAVLIAYLTQGFFSIDVIGISLMGWTAIGALAALSDPLLPDQAAAGRKQNGWIRHRMALVGAVLSASILLMALAVPVTVADVQVRKAYEEQDGIRSAALIQQAIEIHPLEPAYRFKAGKQFLLNAMANDDPGAAHLQYRRATEAYRRGLELQPEMVHEMVNLTLAYTNWAVNNDDTRYFRAADRWFEAASELDPIDYEIAYRRSENLRIWARTTGDTDIREHQISQLQHAISLYRDQPKAWVRLSAAHRALGRKAEADAVLREYFGRLPTGEQLRRIVS